MMMGGMFPVTIGVDWAQDSVQVCVLEVETQEEWQAEFDCDGEGLDELVEWLPRTTGRGLPEMGVAIERPEGPVVEHLRSRGLAVHHMKPTQAHALRRAIDDSGSKDDVRDARMLARGMERHPEAVRLVEEPDGTWVKLRHLDRMLASVKRDEVRLGQAIQAILRRYFPEPLGLLGGQSVSAGWFLELLKWVPTPARAGKVRVSTLEEKVVKGHGVRRFDGAKLKAALTRRPLRVSAAVVEASASELEFEVSRLKDLLGRKTKLKSKRDVLVAEVAAAEDRRRAEARRRDEARRRAEARRRDEARRHVEPEPGLLEVLVSMPGIGPEVVATMLAEGGEVFVRGEYRKVRQLAGTAPVTVSSGRSKVVQRRRARNSRLATAVFQAARVHAQADAGGRAYYKRLRKRGSERGTAIRKVGDRLLRGLMAMVRTRTRYDGSRWAPESRSA